MPTVNPYSDGTPVSITPSGLATSGFDLAVSVAAPCGYAATHGIVFKLQLSPDGSSFGDAGPVLDDGGHVTFETIPFVSDGSAVTRFVSVATPGAKAALLTPRNCAEVPLTVTVTADAY